MRGCAGAGSTQARTLTCMSSPSLALHPCLDLYWFWVLLNSDRAPGFFFFVCTCPDQAGASFGLGPARGFLCLLRLSLAWRSSSLAPVGAVQTIRVQGLGLSLGVHGTGRLSAPQASDVLEQALNPLCKKSAGKGGPGVQDLAQGPLKGCPNSKQAVQDKCRKLWG